MTLLTLLKVWVKIKKVLKVIQEHSALIAFLILVAIIFGLCGVVSAQSDQLRDAAAKFESYKQAQVLKTQALNNQWSDRLTEADGKYNARIKALSDANAQLTTNVERLSHTVSTARIKYVTAPETSRVEYTNTLSDVFNECVKEYSDLADKADQHTIDEDRLIESWPTNLTQEGLNVDEGVKVTD